jgi:hypothetical protein
VAGTAAGKAQEKAGEVAKQADALTARMESAASKLGALEGDIIAQGPRAKLLAKAASELVTQLGPFAGQPAQLFVCAISNTAEQETLDTWANIALILSSDGFLGTTGSKWKLVPTNLSFFDRCGGGQGLGQGVTLYVSNRASSRTMKVAKALSEGLTKTFPPSPSNMLIIVDADFSQRFMQATEGKDTPWAIVANDSDLITVLIGAHPQQRTEKSKTKAKP